MNYADYVRSVRGTPQSEQHPDHPNQVQNSAGGYVFEIDKWEKLNRFLIMGSEGNTYYATERELTIKNVQSVEQCLEEDAVRVVDTLVAISQAGRAPKNEPALFVLALAASHPKYQRVRQYALEKLPSVARTATHLFQFVAYARQFRGWGRSLRRHIAQWYDSRSDKALAYQLIKYKQRSGYSHKDLLILAHVKPSTPARNKMYAAVVHDNYVLNPSKDEAVELYRVGRDMGRNPSAEEAIQAIKQYNLPREALNTSVLNNTRVWQALIDGGMPMTALIRNLGRLAKMGMTERYSENAKAICQQLTDSDHLKKARIHPISVLSALKVYEQGHGERGSLSWTANREIVEALNDAFYASFQFIEPTNKRLLLGVDVSASMGWGQVNGILGLTPAMAAAAMSMVALRTEPNAIIKAFTSSGGGYGWSGRAARDNVDGLADLNISKRMLLDQVIRTMQQMPFGGTDCSLPIRYAIVNRLPIDTFITYTDNESWAGPEHVFESLKRYRDTMGIPAKLISVAFTATEYSIADSSDSGMIDIVGFDSAAPQLMNEFIGKKNIAKDLRAS